MLIFFVSGTTERVCLITGNVDAIMTVLDFIMDKIREKPDLTKPVIEAGDSKLTQERDKQVSTSFLVDIRILHKKCLL